MSINRSIAPQIKDITQVNLLDLEAEQLNNQMLVYQLQGGKQPVTHIQLIYPAGRWYEQKPLQSFFTSAQFLEGTSQKSSKAISELIDLHGATISASASYDVATVELLCLSKHLEPMIQLLVELLTEPSYDSDELALKQQILKRKLEVNLEKTNFVAQRVLHEKIYGKSHPYGYSSSSEKYDSIRSEDLISFHQSHFLNATPTVIISGHFTSEELNVIKSSISALPTGQVLDNPTFESKGQKGKTYIPFDDAKQTTIRMGKPIDHINTENYGKLILANAVLGGYFGSRLMSNLREDKGLTYGVYSQLGSFVHQDYWFIGTDVGKDNRNLAVQEIKKEIQILQNQLVPAEELEVVRNYVMGKYLGKVDGPFSQAKVYKNLMIHNQTTKDFQDQVSQILSTTAEDIMELANQYWSLDELTEVQVG